MNIKIPELFREKVKRIKGPDYDIRWDIPTKSRIRSITPYYSKFENIMPDELTKIDVNKELQAAKSELVRIINEDRTNIQNLCKKENKTIAFDDYVNPEYVVNKAFWIPDDIHFDTIAHRYAHWTMCVRILEILTEEVLDMVSKLEMYYKDYVNTGDLTRKAKFFNFVRAYQDFYGFLISIRNSIEQYYDLFVLACSQIGQKDEKTIYAYKSDIWPDQLLAAAFVRFDIRII